MWCNDVSYGGILKWIICFLQIHHKEKQLVEEFNLLDKAERDLFIHLQAAVKTSHEKEKIHTNSAKYWSIVGSLLGNWQLLITNCAANDMDEWVK